MEVQQEGKYAIDSPGNPTAPVIPPEEYELGKYQTALYILVQQFFIFSDDNEERCMIEPKALDDPKLQELIQVLIEWINDELAAQRIIVQDIVEDLYDGQVLQKLLEKLTGDKLDVPEVTQSEEGQKQKLFVVLNHFNKVSSCKKFHLFFYSYIQNCMFNRCWVCNTAKAISGALKQFTRKILSRFCICL